MRALTLDGETVTMVRGEGEGGDPPAPGASPPERTLRGVPDCEPVKLHPEGRKAGSDQVIRGERGD